MKRVLKAIKSSISQDLCISKELMKISSGQNKNSLGGDLFKGFINSRR